MKTIYVIETFEEFIKIIEITSQDRPEEPDGSTVDGIRLLDGIALSELPEMKGRLEVFPDNSLKLVNDPVYRFDCALKDYIVWVTEMHLGVSLTARNYLPERVISRD